MLAYTGTDTVLQNYVQLYNNLIKGFSTIPVASPTKYLGFRAIVTQLIKIIDFSKAKDGCDFHLMSDFPEISDQYKNSYILVKQNLRYIKSDGTYDTVKIDDFDKFSKMLKDINKDNAKKIHLSTEQVHQLITSNGSHTPNDNSWYTENKQNILDEFDEIINKGEDLNFTLTPADEDNYDNLLRETRYARYMAKDIKKGVSLTLLATVNLVFHPQKTYDKFKLACSNPGEVGKAMYTEATQHPWRFCSSFLTSAGINWGIGKAVGNISIPFGRGNPAPPTFPDMSTSFNEIGRQVPRYVTPDQIANLPKLVPPTSISLAPVAQTAVLGNQVVNTDKEKFMVEEEKETKIEFGDVELSIQEKEYLILINKALDNCDKPLDDRRKEFMENVSRVANSM